MPKVILIAQCKPGTSHEDRLECWAGDRHDRDNGVLMPCFLGSQHSDTELTMAPGRVLDPAEFFIIVPNLLGNGLSSSPSNTPPPLDGPSFRTSRSTTTSSASTGW